MGLFEGGLRLLVGRLASHRHHRDHHLAIFEHNYHPRIYRHNEDVTILQVGDSELDFNHSPGSFTIWW